MSKGIVFITLLALITSSVMAADLTIKRENSVLRSGPASYHKVISPLPVNTRVKELSRQDGWIEVQHKDMKGFTALSSLTAKTLNNDPFAAITGTASSSKVTQHSVTAGVKGFAQYYDSSYGFNADSAFYDFALSYQTDPYRYSAFKAQTYAGLNPSDFRKTARIPANERPDYFSEAHEGFGLAVAAVIARMGLVTDKELNEYLDSVGQLLVEASDGGDIMFRFFILDISQPNAYACPGGYVFISKGMLQAVSNEAELAFVLAHEIAHVTRFHGMIEAKARENQIGAESLFAELDETRPDAFSDKAKAVEEELEKDIMQMFETLIQGRLDAYEDEADQLALVFMARAGYQPNASLSLLSRLLDTRYESNNQHYRTTSLKSRLDRVRMGIDTYTQSRAAFFTHTERLQRMKNRLGR